MTLLLPLLLLPFGLTGAVVGLLAGLLTDEVLYAALLPKAGLALAMGRPWRWFPFFPKRAVAELALAAAAAARRPETVFEAHALVREWLGTGAGGLGHRRFLAQSPRLWAAFHRSAEGFDLAGLAGVAAGGTDPERRSELFGLLVRLGALDADGTDAGDLELLRRVATALDLPVLDFRSNLESHLRLNRMGCALLGLGEDARRPELWEKGRHWLDASLTGPEAELRRRAYAALEDQLDAVERAVEDYRRSTLRESL